LARRLVTARLKFYLRRSTSGAGGNGLFTTIEYLRAAAGIENPLGGGFLAEFSSFLCELGWPSNDCLITWLYSHQQTLFEV
jgi:hypothetical protein